MKKPEMLLLKQEDLIKAGLLDMKTVLEATEKTFDIYGHGGVKMPAKTSVKIPDEEHWTSFGNAMPAYVGGDVDSIGIKWASEGANNGSKGLPQGVDVVILSDTETMFPKALLDGTITTAMRTSAVAGLFAKYNAKPDTEKIALIGAGVIGRTMIMAMKEVLPKLKEIYIVDLDISKAASLAEEFEGEVAVIPSTDIKKSIADADVVVTETTTRKPIVMKEWVKPAATLIQMESLALEKSIIEAADVLIVDSWKQIIEGFGGIHELYEEGKLKDGDALLLQDIVTGAAKGRASEDQFVVCGSRGLGAIDITIAEMLYKKCAAMGLGQEFCLWDEPLWV